MRVCKNCQGQFKPRGNQQYCDKCRIKICPTCNKVFTVGDYFDQKFCSGSCGSKNRIVSLQTRKKHSLHWKPHTLETRFKLSNMFKGAKSHFWKGGITEKTKLRFRNWAWDFLRKLIYKRDNHQCQRCGARNCKLFAHHLIPWRLAQEDNPDKIISLCNTCHGLTEKEFNQTWSGIVAGIEELRRQGHKIIEFYRNGKKYYQLLPETAKTYQIEPDLGQSEASVNSNQLELCIK